ncbi:MAG TPA: hypothetical protein VGJ70_24900 [Solirubrobacteraceae bacterium]|jgi:hypothetical protein
MRTRALAILCLFAGCGGSSQPSPPADRAAIDEAVASSRPIGAGRRFQPPSPDIPVAGCAPRLGPRYAAHVELYAHDRVALFPAGIGTEPPRRAAGGRITRARCYGPVVTLEPTGLVLVRPGAPRRLGDLFRAWGKPLTGRRAAAFAAAPGARVAAFVGGRRWTGDPAAIPLRRHAVIVLEIGPFVPPHRRYAFPPGT